ncbi:ABC transporter substrate-binding protein [Aeromicrobium sp. CTD01-1L150]|uniref:ABC transporter substrate-binding protein n=1 Tax=Aeromicrobium sp. CTD01-1L150 TaxID=3341830 RepID=UPI0035C17358
MRTKFRKAITVALGAVLLAACTGAPSDESNDPSDDGYPGSVELRDGFDPDAEFSYAHSYPPSSFDPLTSSSGLDQTYLAPIYDRLVYRTPEGEFAPMLATEWEPDEEGRSLVVTLREGLAFTDGAPFDADAVKLNLDRYLGEDSRVSQELSQVTGVEVTGPLELTIHADAGLGPLVSALSARPGMMVSPAAIEDGTVESDPVGIGPYEAVEVVPGQSVNLTKTEDYWDPSVQRVATMRLSGMTEAQTRFNAVTQGQLDAASINPNQISAAEREDLDVLSGPTPLFYFFAVNTAEEPFDDPLVREAISLAINRADIGAGLFDGYCRPQVQLWPENSFAYDDDFGSGLDEAPHDPERAKELLDEAGYSGGGSFDTVLTNNSASVQLAEAVQSDLSSIGIEINVNPVPSGGIIDYFAVDKSMPTAMSGYTGSPDPGAVIDRNLTETAPYNPGGLKYPDLEDLIEEGANAIDPEDRVSAYVEYTQRFAESQPHIIPICMLYEVTAFDSAVSNLHATADYTDLRGVAVDE